METRISIGITGALTLFAGGIGLLFPSNQIIAYILFGIGILVLIYAFWRRLKISILPNIESKYFHNQKLYLSDFVKHEKVISDKTFDNCELIGPAVIFCADFDYSNNKFLGYENEITMPIENKSQNYSGIITFDRCSLKNCRLRDVSIIISASRQNKVSQDIQTST